MVTQTRCTCVSNKSEKCKHVAAVIYFINEFESLSKTNFEQQWGRPSTHRMKKEKYAKGAYFHELFPSKRKHTSPPVQPLPLSATDINFPCALKLVLEEADKEEIDHSIENFFNAVERAQIANKKNRECEELVRNLITTNDGDFVVYTKGTITLDNDLIEFYKNNILLCDDAIVKLCCDTLGQSDNKIWFENRQLRISASSNVYHIKIRSRKPVEKLVNEILYPVSVDVRATKYGLKSEQCAINLYQKLYNVKIQQVGLMVHRVQSWLCASAYAIVIGNVGGNVVYQLVEIKCPITCKEVPVVSLVERKCNVPYLQLSDDNVVSLRKTTMYYCQCQVLMYVFGMKLIHFFVYSPVPQGSYRITVYRDEPFLQLAILKSEEFYFYHYLPALKAKRDKSNTHNNNDLNASIINGNLSKNLK